MEREGCVELVGEIRLDIRKGTVDVRGGEGAPAAQPAFHPAGPIDLDLHIGGDKLVPDPAEIPLPDQRAVNAVGF